MKLILFSGDHPRHLFVNKKVLEFLKKSKKVDAIFCAATRYDPNKYKGKRIIGYLYDSTPIIGSKSELIKPLNNSMAPYELYDKKENEYIKREMFLFKKYMSYSDISVW